MSGILFASEFDRLEALDSKKNREAFVEQSSNSYRENSMMTTQVQRLGNMDPMQDKKAFLKQAVKAYKESKSTKTAYRGNPEYIQFLERKRRADIDTATVCVGCPNFLLLTEQVNGILQVQKNHLPENTPAAVFNEINSLEGLFYFVQEENAQGERVGANGGCQRFEYGMDNIFQKEQDLDFDNHIMLFTEEVNFKNITQVHFAEPGNRKTYYLKGKRPDQDVIIRVVVRPSMPPVISYYRHKEVILRKRIQAKKELKEKNIFLNDKNEKKKKDEKAALEDRFSIDYGIDSDDDSFFPNKVTLIGIKGVSHFESTTFTTSTEISTDKQSAELELASKDKKDYLKLELSSSARLTFQGRSDFDSFAISSQVESKGGKSKAAMQLRDENNQEIVGLNIDEEGLASIGVPLQFNVYDTGILVDGRVVAGQDGSYGGTWVISDRDSKTRYVDVGMKVSQVGKGVSLGHSRKGFKENSRLSIKVSHDDFKDHKATTGWVEYFIKF
jgi:hypothetical protein